MSTRSLTRVLDERGDTLATIYVHFDGYPTGHGNDLAEFLRGRKIVNGSSYEGKASNGMECLAAELVASLKDGIGGTYLYPADAAEEEYDYTIRPDGIGGTTLAVRGHGSDLFAGSPEEFDGKKVEEVEERLHV